ncbi:hypothetical protein PT974_09039 [Cladobotryum mycophilum]|uniref:Uncharacterized protein n=1 Tax=Cladobotryum mycophilum TaxID=491253 RepID=A0ABR0SG28_9HYPO
MPRPRTPRRRNIICENDPETGIETKQRLASALFIGDTPKEDPFSEWKNLLAGLYGFIVPGEFCDNSPPYHPWTIRGRARLRYIREQLRLPAETTAEQVETYLTNNISIIRHLILRFVPNPDWYLEDLSGTQEVRPRKAGWKRYCDLLLAIRELRWENRTIPRAIKFVSRPLQQDVFDRAVVLRKMRSGDCPAFVYNRACAADPEFAVSEEQKKIDVLEKRLARPYSLLRYVTCAEDLEEDDDDDDDNDDDEYECFQSEQFISDIS